MTRMLVDFHHSDLAESHQLVYADRFGWDVFIPYGLEWFDQWVWSFERKALGDAVAKQYLLGIYRDREPDANGIVTLPDLRHPGRTLYGITLEAARSMRWDYVMSTVPDNANGFEKLARQTGAAFLIHIGNQWGDEAWDKRPDAAILTTTSVTPANVPHVIVHQEFSLQDFRYESPARGFGPVASFVNCFPEMVTEYQGNFVPTAQAAPEFDWRVYGAYGSAPSDEYEAGNLGTTVAVGMAMRHAGAIWHSKKWSDGFGHVVHNAFAVGRPVFGYAGYYADKLAGPLWVDGVTSIDVGRRSTDEVVTELRRLRDDPDAHLRMCEASAARFREVVSFDDDAERIHELLLRVRDGVPA